MSQDFSNQFPTRCNADTRPTFSARQRRLIEFLQSGKRSAPDITLHLHIGDPRSDIRNLKNKGVVIRDEWVDPKTPEGNRYKRWWIESTCYGE